MSYLKAALASIEDTYRELGVGENGLSTVEARRRLVEYGPNILPSSKKPSIPSRFASQLKNWLNILLLVASGLSIGSGIWSDDSGSLRFGLVLVVVVLLNALFSMVQEYRAERVVQAISRLIPAKAKLVRDGQVIEVGVSDIVPGDLVVLEEGDEVPADIRLVSAFEVSVNNSSLTGESEAQRRFATISRETNVTTPTELLNILFAGTTVVSGVARGVVLQTGANTQFGRIVSLSGQIKEPLSELQNEIGHVGRLTLIVAIIVGALFFGIALAFVGLTVTESVLIAIAVMVSLVPEGMQLTVSLSLALTAMKMAKRNVVVKRLSSVETLGSMTTLCVDKTGTVTSGEMMVQKVWMAPEEMFEVSGDGYSPDGIITASGQRLESEKAERLERLLKVAGFCNNAKLSPPSDQISRWSVLGDPTDGAFLVLAGKGDFNVQEALSKNTRVGLIPFDSNRRMMTTIHRAQDREFSIHTKGASSEILSRCTTFYQGTGLSPVTEELRHIIEREVDAFARQGYRVLAMATRHVKDYSEGMDALPLETDLTFLGLAALADPPRPNVEEAVRTARHAGIRIIMLTGDYELTAEAIARKTGIVNPSGYRIMSGAELAKLDDDGLAGTLQKETPVFARVTPEQKLRVVRILKAQGEIVGVTGDGVNDSPALLEANVGIAMGVGGTDVARESADLILLDNNLVSIIEGVRLGRGGFENLRKFVGYLFTHNWAELGTFVAFIILEVPLPLSVMQVLAIDLGMDVLPSLSLIMEPPEKGVMDRPPTRKNRLLDNSVLLRALYLGVIVSALVLVWAFRVWQDAGWSLGQKIVTDLGLYNRGTTAVMVGIMGAQLGNLFATRTVRESAFKLSPFRNKWLFLGIFGHLTLMISIVYIPFLQTVFGTSSLTLQDLAILYSLAPLVFVIEELRKYVVRRRS